MFTTDRPTNRQLAEALRLVSRVLDERWAFKVEGRYFFPVEGEWFVAISPDDAGRFRVEACVGTVPCAMLMAHATDLDRLAGLVLGLRAEAQALVA